MEIKEKFREMEQMKFYTQDEMLDKHIGKKGSPNREKYDEELNTFLIGEAIKQARLSKKTIAEKPR